MDPNETLCTVVVGTVDERCGKKPASPMPEAEGTWFDFPMCAEHQEMFRKGRSKWRVSNDG